MELRKISMAALKYYFTVGEMAIEKQNKICSNISSNKIRICNDAKYTAVVVAGFVGVSKRCTYAKKEDTPNLARGICIAASRLFK